MTIYSVTSGVAAAFGEKELLESPSNHPLVHIQSTDGFLR
ncbi:unnamed protein product [Victoria cruziana]